MSGEKTEQPTPKKLRDARKKGQVANSRDLSSGFIFAMAVIVLLKVGGSMGESLQAFMKFCLASASLEWDGKLIDNLKYEASMTMIVVLAPLLGGLFIASLMVSFLQAGIAFTMEPLMPSLNKLNPMEGFKRMFSMKGIVNLVKSSLIMVILVFIAYKLIVTSLRPILLTQGVPIRTSFEYSQGLIGTLLMRSAIIMAVVGAADFMYQKWQFNKDMMMSKEDVKNEHKSQEGDPHYKAKRKRMHQELAQGNMLKNARKADVVIVNPTRYAVAVKYDRKQGGAPVVVAKGERVMAEKIREIAKEEGIPIMRNVGLAQALMKVDVDDYIPEDLYEAVAEVLNWVYKLKNAK